MNKRLVSIALLMAMTVFPVVALGSALGGGGVGMTWHAYVVTSNGKGLNIRAYPSPDADVIGSIPYGAEVHLNDYIDQTWVEIDYGGIHGYVMGRYLSYDQPGPVPQPTYRPVPQPTARPTAKPTAQPASSDSLTSLKEMFKNFVFTSYTVQVRPSTPGGFVHMRWAPTKASDPIRDYHQNDILVVIAQNNTWAQVMDPDTGITGFMMRSFLTDIGVGQVGGGG